MTTTCSIIRARDAMRRTWRRDRCTYGFSARTSFLRSPTAGHGAENRRDIAGACFVKTPFRTTPLTRTMMQS
jgi:hypothetical protein